MTFPRVTITEVLEAGTYEDWNNLMDKYYPDGLTSDLHMPIKHILDMTLLNIGYIGIDEFLRLAVSIQELIDIIENDNISPDETYLLNLIIQEIDLAYIPKDSLESVAEQAMAYLATLLNN